MPTDNFTKVYENIIEPFVNKSTNQINITKFLLVYKLDYNSLKRSKKWKVNVGNSIPDIKYKETKILTRNNKEESGTYIDLAYLPKIIKFLNIKIDKVNNIKNNNTKDDHKDIVDIKNTSTQQLDNTIKFLNIKPISIGSKIGYVYIKQNKQTKKIQITITPYEINQSKQKQFNIKIILVSDYEYIKKIYNLYEEFILNYTNINDIINIFKQLCLGKFVIDKKQQIQLLTQQLEQLKSKVKSFNNKSQIPQISQLAGKMYEICFSRHLLSQNKNIVMWQYLDQPFRNKFLEFSKLDYGIDCVDQDDTIFYQLKYYSSTLTTEHIQGFLSFIRSYKNNNFNATFKLIIPDQCQLNDPIKKLLQEYDIEYQIINIPPLNDFVKEHTQRLKSL